MKFVKEAIIVLLTCLVLLLLLAVLFYEYIPSRKEVAEVTTYVPTSKVKEQLSDQIEQMSGEVVLTFEQGLYEVTSTDLNRYEAKKEYVPGKANPFAATAERASGEVGNGNGSSGNQNGSTGSKNGNNSDESGKDSSGNEYIKSNGTK